MRYLQKHDLERFLFGKLRAATRLLTPQWSGINVSAKFFSPVVERAMDCTDLTRRVLLAGLAATPLAGMAAAQTEWPNRTVRVMVPYPPAGGADTTARIVYAKLSEDLGQQFAIENHGGAGGTIGEAVVAKA